MKPATNSRKKAAGLGVLVGGFALWWYSSPYLWLGIIVGLFASIFTFFILTTTRMERLRKPFYIGVYILVFTTLSANILYLGIGSFLIWVKGYNAAQYVVPTGSFLGTTPFPLPVVVSSMLLGKAEFVVDHSVWKAGIPSSIGLFVLFMVPYVVTLGVFDRGFCAWICPFGGCSEGFSALNKGKSKFKFLLKKPGEPSKFSPTGLSPLKPWVEWSRYAFLVVVVMLSLLVPFAIINMITPALWLKSYPIFWIIMTFVFILAVLLPLFTNRRWWCFTGCPVGTALSMFHKISLFQVKIDKTKCNHCMECVKECEYFAMTPQGVKQGDPASGNCIKCGKCFDVCTEDAIDITLVGTRTKVRAPFIAMILTMTFAWYLWFVVLLVSYATKLDSFSIM